MRPVVHNGDMGELIAKYHESFAGRNQECVSFVQAEADIGHTSRWKPGPRVVDQYFISPGTIIANFVVSNGVARYPNRSGWHVAMFPSFGPKDPKGNYTNIWVVDQWRGSVVARRSKKAFSEQEAKRMQVRLEQCQRILHRERTMEKNADPSSFRRIQC